jgi:two-component system CheB/CheR fusion protein
MSAEFSPDFEALLLHLKHTHQCDLSGYKPSSLQRRFTHRMNKLEIEGYQHYLEYLRSHPEEHQNLLDDIFINYTQFFRDADFWNYLATQLIPEIIAHRQPDDRIRVWSAGCAQGQEVVSVLILLAEAIGMAACLKQVKCFATDIDKAILKQASRSIYTQQELENIPSNLLEKYFQLTEKGYVFHPELRRRIVFGYHNLVEHPPISKIDLLICRNVLIYFNSDTQKAVLNRFHFALKQTGFLALGKAEAIVHRKSTFQTVNWRQRIYSKGDPLDLQDLLSILPGSSQK